MSDEKQSASGPNACTTRCARGAERKATGCPCDCHATLNACKDCGGPRNWSLNGVTQDVCYRCDSGRSGHYVRPASPSSGVSVRLPGWSSPSSLTKDEVLETLCRTLDTVWQAFDPDGHEANDCFCGKSTFHRNDPKYFRHSGQTVAWVQDLVREALAESAGT